VVPFRAIIVDDERLARAKIRRFLEEIGNVEVVAECRNGTEVLEILPSLQVDVLFLDVQMPEISGMETLRLLSAFNIASEAMPLVVFITAFDHYAIEAFQEQALDYLVKPFDFERFAATVQRVRATLSVRESARLYRENTQAALPPRALYDERFVFKTRGKIALVEVGTVDWIEAEGNYAVFHVGAARYLLRETLSVLETRLNPASFLRIHRSAIVQIPFLASLEQHADGAYHAIFRDGTRWGVGPTYRDAVRRVLNL
jgi:two-component system, LytTR family, response regulator